MNNLQTEISKRPSKATSLAIDGLFIAITCFVTAFINIKLPLLSNGGLVHLGNVPLFIAAILFGKRTGAIAGAFGMGLFDLLSGWVIWSPFTFVIVGLMGFTTGAITQKPNHKTFKWSLFAIFIACIIKIIGYYIAEGIIYGNWIAPTASIPGNIVQIGIAAILVLPILPTLRKRLNK
jgi:uncharacterized membrane protein